MVGQNNMQINQEQINKVYQLYADLENAKELGSELLRTAQDRFGENEIEVERGGKKVMAKEKDLWEEVYQLGKECEAGKLLDAAHPKVFEAYAKEAELALELKQYLMSEFGIDFKAIKVSDIFRLTEMMIDYKLSQLKS